MTKRKLVLLLAIVLAALACLPLNADAAPKNVILMIGDGMGFGQVALARLSLAESSPSLNMDSMRYTGFVTTHSANSTVTDSAAAGTALAAGFKTNNGMISTLPDGTSVPTILEAASEMGKATGLVTTTTITHATPAPFGSHVPNRGDEVGIAPQLLENRVDILLGGGRQAFIPQSADGSKRQDDRDLLAEAQSAGYDVVSTREGLLSADGARLLGLFQMGGLTTKPPEPSLAEMTEKAIGILSRDGDGFFLMVEGGQIDWACHGNDARGAVKQLFDFDAAIGAALKFARQRGNTLVIVTADHETGGLAILGGQGGARFKVKWATGGHTACNVPLFADGPGSDVFSGVLDNTDVPKRIARLWGIRSFASPAR